METPQVVTPSLRSDGQIDTVCQEGNRYCMPPIDAAQEKYDVAVVHPTNCLNCYSNVTAEGNPKDMPHYDCDKPEITGMHASHYGCNDVDGAAESQDGSGGGSHMKRMRQSFIDLLFQRGGRRRKAGSSWSRVGNSNEEEADMQSEDEDDSARNTDGAHPRQHPHRQLTRNSRWCHLHYLVIMCIAAIVVVVVGLAMGFAVGKWQTGMMMAKSSGGGVTTGAMESTIPASRSAHAMPNRTSPEPAPLLTVDDSHVGKEEETSTVTCTVPPSPTPTPQTSTNSLLTIKFPPHLQQCVPNTSSRSASVGGGPFVRSIAMRRDVIISRSKQQGSSSGGDGGDAPEVHRRPPYVEAELQLLDRLGYDEYRKRAWDKEPREYITANDVKRARDNWINTLPRASMGEDEVRCPAAAQSADPVEAAMAREATEAHALALMLYNQLKDTIQMNVIDSSPVVMDIGCVLGEVFARNHPKATVVCVHSGETFDTYPTVATGTNGTAAAGYIPSNLLHIFAKDESLLTNTSTLKTEFAFARIFEMCNYISVTFALGALRRDLVSRPGSIYATEEDLLALITRLLPPSLLLYTTAPSSEKGNGTSPSDIDGFGDDASRTNRSSWPYSGHALSSAISNQYNASHPFHEEERVFGFGESTGYRLVPPTTVDAVHQVVGTARRCGGAVAMNPVRSTREKESAGYYEDEGEELLIVQYTQLGGEWACREYFDGTRFSLRSRIFKMMRYTGPMNSTDLLTSSSLPPQRHGRGGLGWISMMTRTEERKETPVSSHLFEFNPLMYLHGVPLGALLVVGIPARQRQRIVAQMVGRGQFQGLSSYYSTYSVEWSLSQGGRPMQIDRRMYQESYMTAYNRRSPVGYQHLLAGIACTEVGPDGRPQAMWEIDRRAPPMDPMMKKKNVARKPVPPPFPFPLAPPVEDLSVAPIDLTASPHCSLMCRECSNKENHCYKWEGSTCVPYCSDCSQCMAAIAGEGMAEEYIRTYHDNLQGRRDAAMTNQLYDDVLRLKRMAAPTQPELSNPQILQGRMAVPTTSAVGLSFEAGACFRGFMYPQEGRDPNGWERDPYVWEDTDSQNVTNLPQILSEIKLCEDKTRQTVFAMGFLRHWSANVSTEVEKQVTVDDDDNKKKNSTVTVGKVRPASVQRALNTIAADFGGDEEAYLRHVNDADVTASNTTFYGAFPLTRQEIMLARGRSHNSRSGANSTIPTSFGWLQRLATAPTDFYESCKGYGANLRREERSVGAHLYNGLKDSIQRTLMVGGRTVDGNIGEAYGNEDLGSGGNEDTSGDRPKNASYSHTSAPTVLDIGCVVGEVFARHHPQATVICVHIGRRYTTDPSPNVERINTTAYPTNIIHIFSREEDIRSPTFFTPSSPKAAPLANLLDQCHYFTMAFVLTDLRADLQHVSPDMAHDLLKRIIPIALTVYGAHDSHQATATGSLLMRERSLHQPLGLVDVSVVSSVLGFVWFSPIKSDTNRVLIEYRQRYSKRQCVVRVADNVDDKKPHSMGHNKSSVIRSSFIKHNEGLFWRDAVVSEMSATTRSAAPNPSRYVAMNPLSYAAQIPRVDVALLLRVGIDAYTRTLMLGRVLTAVSRLESSGNVSTLKGVQGIVTRSLLSQLLGTAGGSIDTAADRAELGQFPAGWGVGLGGQLVGPSTDLLPSVASPTGSASASLTPQSFTEHLCLPPLQKLAGTLFTTGRVDDTPLLSFNERNVSFPRPPQIPAMHFNINPEAMPSMLANAAVTTTPSLKFLRSRNNTMTINASSCLVQCEECISSVSLNMTDSPSSLLGETQVIDNMNRSVCSRCGSCLVAASAAGRGLRFPFLPLEPYVGVSPLPCPRRARPPPSDIHCLFDQLP